jgi:hypothetical protein
MEAAAKPPYELEAAGLEEFLRLLQIRIKEPQASEESLPRRAVCVADMYNQSSTEIGVARVKRYVRAAFVYGDDLVSLQLVSSDGYEHPNPEEVCKLEEKQTRLLDKVRDSVTAEIEDSGLCERFPVVKAFIHPAKDPRVAAR